jgi:hypothetical protein
MVGIHQVVLRQRARLIGHCPLGKWPQRPALYTLGYGFRLLENLDHSTSGQVRQSHASLVLYELL